MREGLVVQYWAAHEQLVWIAFIVPCFANTVVATAGYVFAVASQRLTLVVFLIVGPCLVARSIYFTFEIYVQAAVLESTLFEDLVRASYAMAGLTLFCMSFRVYELIFRRDDQDDDWGDNDPEPDDPPPTDPSGGSITQTCSSRLPWSVQISP